MVVMPKSFFLFPLIGNLRCIPGMPPDKYRVIFRDLIKRIVLIGFEMQPSPKLFSHISLAVLTLLSLSAQAQQVSATAAPGSEIAEDDYAAVMPTVFVTGTSENSATKGYIGYDQADVTRTDLTVKETPQAVDVLDIQKNKNYGTNDLSSILEGNAGIDATYDMRGESIKIRGFSADASDIYRDGVRESGQVRRSTANIERVEILKGPSSVLYGRSSGGGVINMVSKYANFTPRRSLGLSYGSWAARSATVDLNQLVSENVAVRLTGEVSKANSWRSTVHSKGHMVSPSVTVRAGNLVWTGQYTHDSARRVPDRTPSRDVYNAMGIDYRTGFARDGDFVRDDLSVLRSDLRYDLNDQWNLRWQLAGRKAEQNFDHYYAGSYNAKTRLLRQNYYWQETANKTLSSGLTANGRFSTGPLAHKLTVGLDWAKEERLPKLATCTGPSAITACVRDIDPYASPSSWGRVGQRPALTANNQHEARSTALFVQDLIALRPDVKVLLGGRYDRYTFQSTNIASKSSRYSGSSFNPNAGLVWDVTPEHTAYASWSRSFAPYGGNGYLGVDAAADPVTFNADPEQSTQFELGLKSDWLDRNLSTTLAIYNLEHTNIRYRPDAVNEPTVWAVRGKERSRGIELNVLGRVSTDWYVRGSLGLMSAKVVENRQNRAEEGRYLTNTSRISSNAFVRYAPNPWYAEVGVTHLGKRYYYVSNVEHGLPAFTRVDAMVGYNAAPWTFTLAVQNVFDKQYWRSSAMPGSPRAVTFKASYEF